MSSKRITRNLYKDAKGSQKTRSDKISGVLQYRWKGDKYNSGRHSPVWRVIEQRRGKQGL
ncbi:hypothetical protein G5S_0646 [Chlamydia pecorum E58]|uniref:Uncharacterized protein n=1 Tax=Chlamydia pecorum (strain ATCC VR-628 / DSM 29919 / E58) TaxID=331635 RepID=A0AA34WI02_CHLPE|nr:hypothetical protein G5S_0646 [Chlamydia pecorum E58]